MVTLVRADMLSRHLRIISTRAPAFSSVRASTTPILRTYATPAATPDSKPPVALYGLDGTYASALYTAAAKASSLDTTSRSLASLLEIFKREARLKNILAAPTLTPGDKSKIIQELQKHMGSADKGDTVKNFLQTLADNNRLSILESICEKFSTLMVAARGEIDLIITSAQKLDSKTLQRLEAAIAKSEYSQGRKLKVVPKVNPEIKGGLVVEVGDRTIDLSVSSKIAKMNKLLTDSL